MNRFKETIQELKNNGNYRELRSSLPAHSINLSSNDYLGLLNEEQLYANFIEELHSSKHAFSAASSRLLTGNSKEYKLLESVLTQQYKKEAALVFNSGYHANCGILPALASSKDLILADKLVHASIIDGLKLSSAQFERYRHLDYEHLEKILKEKRHKHENVWIVSESIFSMDGDCANLQKLVEIKQLYNTFLYIDEAHALGVRGLNGLGICEEQNCIENCDFIVGTFGKAIASVVAFVVCNNICATYLINHARTLIFTTALPPINLAWTRFIMEQLPQFKEKRMCLETARKELESLLQVSSDSHIIPAIIGSNKQAIDCSKELCENGIYVLPIRYPTVPKNTARLRFSLYAGVPVQKLSIIPKIISQYI